MPANFHIDTALDVRLDVYEDILGYIGTNSDIQSSEHYRDSLI
jgi:hypothetical protein